MKLSISIFFFVLALHGNAQILNVESLRKVTDTTGWSGSAGIDFAFKRNVNDFVSINNDIHIQYKMKKHLILLKNDLEFQKIEGDHFTNSGILHLRYNYKFRPRFTWEAFVQGQYNKVSKIDFRGLVGSGFRYKLSSSEKYKFYLGTLLMFEYEELSGQVNFTNKDLRGSSYLSFSLYPTGHITIVSTTYYQPLMNSFKDYRVSSQSSAAIGLFKNFVLKMTYTFTHDTFPVLGIPNSQYSFTTGIAYTFD